jgi:hypothetical protein
MYWPIGAPRIYAASKHELYPAYTTTSDDGSERESTTETEEDDRTNGTAIPARDGEEDATSEDEINGDAHAVSASAAGRRESDVQTLKSNGAAQQAADDDPGGEIVGLQLSRSGHMFATITKSTLTVWQTKVRPCIPTF